jgi:hypothetical protein
MTLGRSLAPLEPLKRKINVINGLFNRPAVGMGIHPAQTGNLLSGVPIRKGAHVRAGVTVDQVLASRLGRETPQRSLALACEPPMAGCHETSFSLAYSSHISWRTAESPVPNEIDPALAFDSLVENRGRAGGTSVLDRIRDRARYLGRSVSVSDQARLDQYLTSVREVEMRIERLQRPLVAQAFRPAHGRRAALKGCATGSRAALKGCATGHCATRSQFQASRVQAFRPAHGPPGSPEGLRYG